MSMPRVVIAADGRAFEDGVRPGAVHVRASRQAMGVRCLFHRRRRPVDRRGEMHIRPDGYIGVAPLAGGVANVCVVRELEKHVPAPSASIVGDA